MWNIILLYIIPQIHTKVFVLNYDRQSVPLYELVNRNNSSLLHILATTSTTTIDIIITRLIAHTAAKTDTAEYHETALEAAHADPNEDMQDDTRINHIRKSAIYVGSPTAGQLDIAATNDNRYLTSFADPLEKYLIVSQR